MARSEKSVNGSLLFVNRGCWGCAGGPFGGREGQEKLESGVNRRRGQNGLGSRGTKGKK